MGLDPKQIIEIRSLIKELGKEHTVIVSSHILSEINQICDKVIIINNGEIVAIDTPKNLEEKTKEQNILYLTVEDVNNKMSSIKDKITDIKELNLVKEVETLLEQESSPQEGDSGSDDSSIVENVDDSSAKQKRKRFKKK